MDQQFAQKQGKATQEFRLTLDEIMAIFVDFLTSSRSKFIRYILDGLDHLTLKNLLRRMYRKVGMLAGVTRFRDRLLHNLAPL